MISMQMRVLQQLFSRLRVPDSFVRLVASTFILQMITLLFGIGTGAITARWLGPEGRGFYQLGMLLPAMFSLFLGGGIGSANVYFAGMKRMDIGNLIGNSITLALMATVAGWVLAVVFIQVGWMAQIVPGMPLWLMILGLVALPLVLLQMFLSAILQGMQKIEVANLISLAQSILILLFTIFLVIVFKAGVAGAFVGYLCALGISLWATILFLQHSQGAIRPQWQTPVVRRLLGYGAKGYVGNLLQFYNYRLDNFLVNYFLGASEVGIYGVAVRLAELLWRFPDAVSFVIFPKAASTQAKTMNQFTPRILGITFLITLTCAGALAAVAKPLIHLVFGAQFGNAYWPLLALLPGTILLGAGKVLANEIAGRGYPHYNSINSGISLIFTIIFDLMLIPQWGIIGAAVASSIAYTVTFLLSSLFYWHVHRIANQEQVVYP